MHKKASIGDIISAPVAIVTLVLILILFGLIFFGPWAFLRADKDITLNGIYFTDSTRIMNLLKSEYEGTIIAENIVASYLQEYSPDKLEIQIEDYLNYLPSPEMGSWHLKVYKDDIQVMEFGDQTDLPEYLIQQTVIPIKNSNDILRLKLYLACDCDKNVLEDYV